MSAHSGYFISLSRISFFYRRTGAGPQHIAIEVNGTEIGRLEDVAPDEVLFFDQALSLVFQSDVEVKIKGWNGGSGDFRVNDVRLDGEIAAAGLTTWSGAGNNDWHQAENWSDGIPDAHTDAVIPGDAPRFPTIDPGGSNAAVNNLLLEDGASLLDNGKLTIHGDFVMERAIDDGGFAWHFISAPVDGMAVIGSDFVPAPPWTTPRTFDFYAFNEAAQSAGKQLMQSASEQPMQSVGEQSAQSAGAEPAKPIGEQTAQSVGAESAQSAGKQTAPFASEQSAQTAGKQSVHPTAAESAKPWMNVRLDGENASPAFVNFVPGKGYLVAYHEDYPVKTFAFSGRENNDKIQMNTGNIDIILGYSSDADPCNQGWNLLGNPYPSGIDWSALAHYDLFENVYAYVYNPNKTGGAGYETIGPAGPGVAGQVIAPNQGFFVKAAPIADGQPFTFTDNIRVHGGTFRKGNDQQAFLKDNDPQGFLTLKFADGEFYDHTTLRVQAGTAETIDSHDAHKLFSFSAEVPQLYSKTTDGIKVAINAVPEVNDESVFPVGLRVPETGTYAISLEETGGQFARTDIYLYDSETDTETLLSQAGRYEFDAEASGDDPGEPRFRIGFKTFQDATTTQAPQASMAKIYTSGNTLVIEFTEAAPHRQVGVYDLGGRTILRQPLENASVFRRALDLTPGVYVVRISDRTGTQTERVLIQ